MKGTKAQGRARAELFEDIVRLHLRIDTLVEQKIDRLDFHEVAVWNIKSALEAAYKAGEENAGKKAGIST